ncbi:50S ribosomal protein L32 [Pseudomonas oryzihabitans]
MPRRTSRSKRHERRSHTRLKFLIGIADFPIGMTR